MIQSIDPAFGEKFVATAGDFYRFTVERLFNEWWQDASEETIAAYNAAIEDHPEHGPLAREGWLAPAFSLGALAECAPGAFGAALHDFVVDHNLAEHIAEGYRQLHAEMQGAGKVSRMPPALEYKVLRGHQTHDMHHVLTGYPPTPLGELAIQAFQLAQMDYPYAAMWIATVTAHMTFIDPKLIKPAMDAIVDGWSLGRSAQSIQFIRLEDCYNEPLDDLRARFGLNRDTRPDLATPADATPDILAGSVRKAA